MTITITITYGNVSVVTSTTYNGKGRAVSQTDALDGTVQTAYDDLGSVIAQWGATYPVAYTYDAQGRKNSMRTFRDEPGGTDAAPIATGGDLTQWLYEHATGLCTNKVYADGSSVSYTFTPDGKPLRTTWARDVWKENAYDALGQINGTVYSDNTPAVTLARNAHGTVTNAADSSGVSYSYAVNTRQLVTAETVMQGNRIFSVGKTRDDTGRPVTTAVGLTNAVYASKSRAYDNENRLASLAFTNSCGRVCTASYAYTDARETNLTVTLPNGNIFTRSLTRDAHRPSLVTRHDYRFNNSAVLWHACDRDILGRVTNAWDSLSVVRAFLYNDRSEVTGAAIGTNSFGYAFDPIGNRISTTENAKTTEYLVNSLNQYSQISVSSVPPWLNSPAYDADGNMLSDGEFSYAWDVENRLVSAAPLNPVSGSKRVQNRYDWRHRLIRMDVQSYGNGTWHPHETRAIVYDGWLPVLEFIDHANGTSGVTEYFWGNDLSGSEQGAGGVGGLLAVSVDGQYHLPCYDHNGNITAYIGENGTPSAQYLYDAFGNTLEQSGPMADALRFRFSTKYFVPETRSYYYGYRFYSPDQGRWLNFDPIGEKGGLNLYGFVGNDPVNGWDRLGLLAIAPVDDSPKIEANAAGGINLWASAFIILDGRDNGAVSDAGGGILVHGKRVTVALQDCNTGEDIKESEALQKRLSIPARPKATQPATDGNAYIHFNLAEMNGKGKCAKGTIKIAANWHLYPKGASLPPVGNGIQDDLSGSLDGEDTHGSISSYDGWPNTGQGGYTASGRFDITVTLYCGGDYDVSATASPLHPTRMERRSDGINDRKHGSGYMEWPWYSE